MATPNFGEQLGSKHKMRNRSVDVQEVLNTRKSGDYNLALNEVL